MEPCCCCGLMNLMQEATLNINGKQVKVRYVPPGSYRPNPQNHNKGKERGDASIRHSLKDSGWHRGMFTAANGEVIGGNHAYQSAEEEGIIEGWIEVETDGTLGVNTKRLDWADARVPEAIKAAIADNRTQQLNFDPDMEQMLADLAELSAHDIEFPAVYYTLDELDELSQKYGILGNGGSGQSHGPKDIDCVCPACGHQFVKTG